MEIKEIAIEKIKPDKNQPRKKFIDEEIKNLALTYEKQGIIKPIEVDEDNKIITGEIRWRAAKEAGLKTIPCIIKCGLTPTERLKRQLIENLHHHSLSIFDCRDSIKKIYERECNALRTSPQGKSLSPPNNECISQLARELGVSRDWLSDILGFEKDASVGLKKMVVNGRIPAKAAISISKDYPKSEQKAIAMKEEAKRLAGEIENTVRKIENKKDNPEIEELKRLYYTLGPVVTALKLGGLYCSKHPKSKATLIWSCCKTPIQKDYNELGKKLKVD